MELTVEELKLVLAGLEYSYDYYNSLEEQDLIIRVKEEIKDLEEEEEEVKIEKECLELGIDKWNLKEVFGKSIKGYLNKGD